MESAVIYLVTGPTGKRYVGQAMSLTRKGKPHGAEGRWKRHVAASKGNNKEKDRPLQVDIRQYGKDAFTVETLMVCNQKDANEYERKAMILHDAIGPDGYNKSLATLGGRVSAVAVENMSKSKAENHREKIGQAHVGKKRSAEACANMSEGQKGKRVAERNKESGLPRYVEKRDTGGYVFRFGERVGDELVVHRKSFSKVKKYSDGELLEMTMKYRNEYLKEHGMKEDDEPLTVLPKFVYRCKDRPGLVVRTPLGGGKHKSKGFNVGDGGSTTEAELIDVATAYRDSVLDEGKVGGDQNDN